MLASAATLFALVFALTEGMSYGWSSPLVLGSLAAAAAGVGVFVRLEQRREDPLLELSLFRSRNLSGANAVSLLPTAVMCGICFFISLYLQVVRGYTPIEAGAAFLPMTLLICFVAPVSGRISDRIGRRLPAASGNDDPRRRSLAALGAGSQEQFLSAPPWPDRRRFGIGLTAAPVTAAALDFGPTDEDGVRAGILNTSRMIGLAIGIALMGAIVTAR